MRDAEVREDDTRAAARAIDEHVVGLHVAVNDPGAVGGAQRLGQRDRDTQRDLGQQAAPARVEDAAQAGTFDELADDVPGLLARGRNEVVHRQDRRVANGGHRVRLAAEPGLELGAPGEESVHDLDRDVAAQLRVARAIHGRHAAAAELGLDEEPSQFLPDEADLRGLAGVNHPGSLP